MPIPFRPLFVEMSALGSAPVRFVMQLLAGALSRGHEEGAFGFLPVGRRYKGPAIEVLNLLWVFLIISALQPVVQRRYSETMRARKIPHTEEHRGSRVILLVLRQETMSLLGFPLMRFIDIDDSEEVLRAIQLTDDDVPLDIVLHTPGGLVLAAMQIARAVEAHKGRITVFVPHYAMSGGTLIALAADEIVMCRHSVLGPIDPQLGPMPAASLLKVLEQKPVAEIDDQTLVMADVGRKAITQVGLAAAALLRKHMGEEEAQSLAAKLASRTRTHDSPIAIDEGKGLGLPVATPMPDEFLELMFLYPQPVRQQGGGVEYRPEPRQREAPAQ